MVMKEGWREGRGRREKEKEGGSKQERAEREERKRHWILIDLLTMHLTGYVSVLDLSEASVFSSVKWE